MYPASAWSAVLRAIMDISAYASGLADRRRTGHLGHQCSYAPGRPIVHRLILSQTSAGNPCASAVLRSKPAFFKASIFSGPGGIDRAASNASVASASQSRSFSTGLLGIVRNTPLTDGSAH